MRILVADDDPTYRTLLQGLLETMHFDVLLAENGTEALEMLGRPNGPELAILDFMMPGLDGYEVCRQIRQTKGDEVPYVILMTGSIHRNDLTRVLVAGADDYLLKPFEPMDLKIRLRTALRILGLLSQRQPAASL